MKFSDDQKQMFKKYILEKISQGANALSQTVADTFDINPSTVHTYINELLAEGVIRKIKRDEYELVSQKYVYELTRSAGELEDDTYAFRTCVFGHIKDLKKNVQDIWNFACTEMINNVMDHSQAENVRIIVEQDALMTSVVIVDDGIGIFKKIREHFNLTSEEDAICELFKGKLTTDTENHSGEGIFFSSKMMDEFYIISGQKVFTNDKYDDGRVYNLTSEVQSGTCVYMVLSNDSRRTAKEVFDDYVDVEGGFIKTKIPLKNIFDTSPVSRSQAKRVCNRLDQFEEVEIDFSEINWVGQGFAHQLFVIFATAHPDIVLTPINMNEDVMKMVTHVRMSAEASL